MLQPSPPRHSQPLDRPKRRLVRHLPALLDPVAEVQVAQAELSASLDLPQDVVGPIARAGWRGVIKGVNRRQTIV